MSIHLSAYVRLVLLVVVAAITILNAVGKVPVWPAVLLLALILAAE